MLQEQGWSVTRDGDTVSVELEYPRSAANPKYIRVGLTDVRAADDILIHYDFDRDGWVIEQASVFAWCPDDKEQNEGWIEVAFVQAWGSERVTIENCECP